MICPKCGDEMNHHADKMVHPITVEDAKDANAALGGLIEETHGCPGCGSVEFRREK
jgi:predicted RNA-binding Zn-ribbon protein involved in translation (DUF1610 family)